MKRVRTVLAIIALAATCITGCTEDPVFPAQGLVVKATNVPQLSSGAAYELWLSYPHERANFKDPSIEHDEPMFVSAGRFTVDASGAVRAVDGTSAASLAVPAGYNPALIGEALVTVETLADADGEPDARLLWGVVTGDSETGTAKLVAHSKRTFDSAALFSVAGTFMLDAPTSSDLGDQLSGVWLASRQGALLESSTNLTPLPNNHDNDYWIYEAWLRHATATGVTYRSLGRFRRDDSADGNGAGPEAGPVARAYAFPGEDFVTTRRHLADTAYGVIISLQPKAITLTSPLLRLLERASIPSDATEGTDISMSAVLSDRAPSVEITIAR